MGLQRHHRPRGLLVLIRRAPQWEDPAIDGAQLLGRRRLRGSVFQPSERRDEEWSLAPRRFPLRRGEELLTLLERTHVARQDTGERVVGTVEADRPADRVSASA